MHNTDWLQATITYYKLQSCEGIILTILNTKKEWKYVTW